jgi:prolipoprotein diacylglyceryltransferase
VRLRNPLDHTAQRKIRIGERPLISCWSQPAVHVGQFTLYAHGILLALGTVVSSVIFINRAQTFSLSKRVALSIILFLVPIGLLASHLTYSILEDPSSLLELQGISSLGGILACLMGLALFTFWHRESRWRWFDAAAYAGVCGALVARLGCFLAHDRIGLRTSFWFSVNCFDGSHYDLALFEVVFLAVCLGLIIWFARQGWRPFEGMIFSMVAVSYGLLRLALGQLSEGTQRYVGLLPEQFCAVILVAAGAFCWLLARHRAEQASAALFTKEHS